MAHPKNVKTIPITGASSGFGFDTAKTLATAGHRVFATMRNMDDRHRAAAEKLRSEGIHTLDLDVTDDESVDTAFEQLFKATDGKLDVLINNAGMASAGISEAFTPDQLRDLFEVNVFGLQRVLRAALPKMRIARPGLIINVGSILGRVTFPFFGLHGASKYAVEALTDGYRYELSQLGIDVVLVQPSAYPTNMYSSIQKPAEGSRADEYGEIAAIPGKLFETFMGIFGGTNAPNPHDVASTMLTLVEAKDGERPERVVVGTPFGADAANEAIAPIQAQVLTGLGLQHLSNLKL
jgi:NAD(P)-dependent dehydrogenase (short-subunit alcohol dehydrogenase family)